MIKSYLDLSGLTYFHDKVVAAAITDANKNSTTIAPSISATRTYVTDITDDIIEQIAVLVDGKLSKVEYNTSTGVFTSKNGSTKTIFTADNTSGGTSGSYNLITSGAVKTAIDDLDDRKVEKVTGSSLMTNAEHTKLAGIEEGANNYVHPLQTSHTKDLYKVAVDGTGHITDVTQVVIDTTAGGVQSSGSLITSGAVNAGLASLAGSTVNNVVYNTTDHKLKQTIGSTTSNVATVDTTPAEDSDNLITSGAIYTSVTDLDDRKINKNIVTAKGDLIVGAEQTEGSTTTYVPSKLAIGSNGQVLKVVNGTPAWQTDTNTTYTFATGDTDGTFKVTPYGGSAQEVAIKGLDSAAYTKSTDYATAEQGTHAETAYTAVTNKKTTPIKDSEDLITSGGVYTSITDLDDRKMNKSVVSAKGDIIYGAEQTSAGTTTIVPSKLTIGSSGQVLKVSSSGIPTWGTDNNTTYTFATGTANGTINVTPSGGTLQAVSVYGLKSAAYTESTVYATSEQGTNADDAKEAIDNAETTLSESSNLVTSGAVYTAVSDLDDRKVEKVDGSSLMTSAEHTKLAGIATGAEVNQNAFSNVVVGETTIVADTKTDTLTLVAGTDITLTPDATNDKITITAKSYDLSTITGVLSVAKGGTGISSLASGEVLIGNGTNQVTTKAIDSSVVSSSTSLITSGAVYTAIADVDDRKVDKVSGSSLMTNAEHTKLAGIEEGANKYTHPLYTSKTLGLYKIAVDGTGHVSSTTQLNIDTTAGGIYGSADLITSGAVNAGLSSIAASTVNNVAYDTSGAQSYLLKQTIGSTTSNVATVDLAATTGSKNLITSGAVYSGLNGKVDKTTKINNHALSDDVTITASDVGLGNVTNESKATMFTSPTFTGTTAIADLTVSGSASFTNSPTAPTPTAGSDNTNVATTAYVKKEINDKIAAAGALIYKGTIGTSSSTITTKVLPNNEAKIGWLYVANEAGGYTVGTGSGTATTTVTAEAKDMFACLTAGSTETYATWTIIQGNLDGVVIGPSSAVDSNIAVFDSTTGKLIKDGGKKVSDFSLSGHTHNYAASSSAGGSATSVALEQGTSDQARYVYFANTSATDTAAKLVYDSDFKYNPATNTLTVTNVSGNSATATKATQDSSGQNIADTYIKALSVNGRVITYTKGDGDTGTITTQDTVYTHPTGDGNLHVPATSTTNNGKFLMAGSTAGSLSWATPTDTKATVTVSGTGNAITSMSASDGAITAYKGTTFLTASDITGKADKLDTVTSVTYNTTSHKLTKTINGTTTDIATVETQAGGIKDSDNLITSGAVNAGLAAVVANTVSGVSYDSTNHKLTKTVGSTTTDITIADATVTQNSNNLVTSGAVYTAIANAIGAAMDASY